MTGSKYFIGAVYIVYEGHNDKLNFFRQDFIQAGFLAFPEKYLDLRQKTSAVLVECIAKKLF
ncbi:MAG: hypothetical protein HOK91_08405 [Gammaproteobacteria bacterium]|jgi:hypothetical protein|nr:hypothetical protein [Gammaproteobacteria bacterium]